MAVDRLLRHLRIGVPKSAVPLSVLPTSGYVTSPSPRQGLVSTRSRALVCPAGRRRFLPPIARHVLLVLGGALIFGCEEAADASLGELELTSGAAINALAIGHDTAIALVYDPSECFTCSGTLADWIEVARTRPVKVLLILTREPLSAEARMLSSYRVPIAGVLAPSWGLHQTASMELLFVNGKFVASAMAQETSQSEIQRLMKLRSQVGTTSPALGSQ